jgi:hypothetical protein
VSDLVFPALPLIRPPRRQLVTSTTVFTSPTSDEQRVARQLLTRYRFPLQYDLLREDVAAPAPYQSKSELDVVLWFFDQHRGALESFLFDDPTTSWRSNLFPYSEPLLAEMAHTAGVTQGTLTDGGLSNGMTFPAVAQADNAYSAIVVTVGISYVVSAFVKMADLSAPVVGLTSSTGDFMLISDNATTGYHDAVVTNLGGNLYRVSSARTATVGGAQAAGVFRYATQSGKGFTVSGYQIEVAAALPLAYLKTSGAAFSPRVRVRFEDDDLDPVPVGRGLYSLDCSLVTVVA